MKILLLLSLVSFSASAQTLNAVQALKKVLPDFEYTGSDPMGERCLIDLFGRPNGDMMVELSSLGNAKYLVKLTDSFTLTNGVFTTATNAPAEDGRGVVTRSLKISGDHISIGREFVLNERRWVSEQSCVIED